MKYRKNFRGDWDESEWQEIRVKEKNSRKMKENRIRKARSRRGIY